MKKALLIGVVFLASVIRVAAEPPVKPQIAALTFPADGSVLADATRQFTWTAAPNAQAYYLYVGTSAGATDLVNTGEINTTSFAARNLPVAQTIYARVWTKVAGIWWFADSSFSMAAPPPPPRLAAMTYPVNGSALADFNRPLTWTTSPDALAYYLYVGTSVGAKDLINTGETQATSFTKKDLPTGRTLYVRLWTKVASGWLYADSSFSNSAAALISPKDAQIAVDLSQPVTWTPITNADVYTLHLGTGVGAKDLFNSGEVQQTSLVVKNVTVSQVIYARLWTRVSGIWRSRDSTFGAVLGTLTYPIGGRTDADYSRPFTWTVAPHAEKYYLYIGTTPGGKDLVDSGELQQTTFLTHLATSRQLFARLWTKVYGIWAYVDSTFSSVVPVLLYPPKDATNVDLSLPFRWSAVPEAQAYYLYVGTSVGAKDLVNTGDIQTTSFTVRNVPAGQKLYIRLWAKVGGVWRYTDSTFAALPSDRRIQSADLVYQGAFRLPGDLDAFGRAYEYGGKALAFNPAGNSLFAVGHLYDQMTGEMSIPSPGIGEARWLPRATALQPLTDALEGHLFDVAPEAGTTVYISGQFVYGNQLYVTASVNYASGQLKSHFVRPLALSATGSVGGPFAAGPLGANFYSGYFGLVPPAWQLALGGPVLNGACCMNLISRTSYGPAAFAINPTDIGVRTSATPLVFYPDAHQTLGGWNVQSTLFNGTTEITGVVFPTGTSSVLFFGRHGTGPYCYGEADACNDPSGGSKGDHAYPYIYQVWAYDAADLAQVHNGFKQPWDIVPYAVWPLNLPFDPAHGVHIGGAAYDPATGRIFVSQEFGDGDEPIIHVFTLASQ